MSPWLRGLTSSDLALALALPVALAGARYGALVGAGCGLAAGAVQGVVWLKLSPGNVPIAPALAAGLLAVIGGLVGELAARDRARRLAQARGVWTSLRSAQLSEFLSYALYQLREYQISVTSLVETLALSVSKGDTAALTDRLERLRRVVAELNGKAARLFGENSVPTARRSRAGDFEIAELARQAAAEALVAFAGEPPAPVAVSAPDGAVSAAGDMLALRLVMLAALQNSLEACAARGQGSVTVTVRRSGQEALIEIADNAGGPIADAATLFEPFFSARSGSGLGLGLSMARRMIERAGGTLAAKPRPGGLSIEIQFPLRRDLPFLRNDETTWARRRQAI